MQQANRSFLAGRVRDGNRSIAIAAGQTLNGIPDIGLLLIGARDGRPVYVRDVATVVVGAKPVERRAWHFRKTAEGSLDRVPAVTVAIAKRAAAADSAATEKLTKAALAAGQAAETGKAEPPPKPKVDTGMVTALAVGAAGLGGMIGSIVNGFLNLGGFMPLGVIGILLLISGPSMILAWLKLRNRNLGPLLDANGWAINTRARINVPFGTSLTSLASLPPGSQRDLMDPYADKANPWPKILIFLIIIGIGIFGRNLFTNARSLISRIFGSI